MASPPEREVAALESCFRSLPADAVPAVVDCVLASSTSSSPSQLFHALLRSSPPSQRLREQQGLQAQSDHAAICHAAALRHLLAQFDSPPMVREALRLLLWRVFLPLLRDSIQPSHPAHFHQVIAMMCDAVSDTGSWDLLGATIVSFCIRSSVVAMDLSAADANAMLYQSTMEADFPGESLSRLLPLSNSSSVLASLLVDMLERRRTIPTSQEGAADLDALVQNLTWDLSKLILKMFRHAQEFRSCATRILLQPVLTSLADVSCVTVSFGAVQHKLSRLLKVYMSGNYV